MRFESTILNASAGCGKTRAIVHRICDLLKRRVPPSKIMCVSFTKNASENIMKRLIVALEKDDFFSQHSSTIIDIVNSIKFFTVHSFCYFILKRFIKEMPLGRICENFNYDEILHKVPSKNYSILEVFSLEQIRDFLRELPEETLTQCSIKGLRWYIEALGRKISVASQNIQITNFEKQYIIDFNVQILEIGLFLKNYRLHQRSVCLFEDLVAAAYQYLYMDERGEGFSFSICQEFDHMLVDESQDNSRLQWKILLVLINEAFHDPHKSFFIAGDEKQSIFSFQNADYEFYLRTINDLETKARLYRIKLVRVEEKVSSRTPGNVIKAINNIFNHHKVFKISPQETKKKYGGKIHCLELVATGPRDMKLGIQIASFIEKILNNRTFLKSKKREVRPTDIMVLFRNRGTVMQNVHDCLQKNSIPSSGADKVFLFSSAPFMFILDLVKLCLDPTNELLLIKLLQNYPFFLSIDSEENVSSVWDYAKINLNFPLKQMAETMSRYTTKISPHNFLFKMFFEFEVYYKLIDRKDHALVHEILGIAADSQYVNIWNFVNDFPKHIKQPQTDGVLLSTVHGAKGTQAPIVIVADSTVSYNEYNASVIIEDDDLEPELKVPIFNVKKNDNFFKFFSKKAYKKKHKEFYRELYVTLTRTEDEIYFTGWKPLHKDSWYEEVRRVFK